MAIAKKPRRVARPKELVRFLRTVAADGAITVEIPLVLPSAANKREHWRKRAERVKRERLATRIMLVGLLKHTRPPVHVTFVRIAPRPILDLFENLPMAFKGCKDEIAALLGIDDGDASAATWECGEQQRRGQAYGVRVEIRRRETP